MKFIENLWYNYVVLPRLERYIRRNGGPDNMTTEHASQIEKLLGKFEARFYKESEDKNFVGFPNLQKMQAANLNLYGKGYRHINQDTVTQDNLKMIEDLQKILDIFRKNREGVVSAPKHIL
jgi:hypothetical protein